MRKFTSAWMLKLGMVCLALCAHAGGAHAIRALQGRLPSGAYYKIEAPDNWRAGDPVVLFQHGFSMDQPSSNIDLGPLKDMQLAQGFAVAATSYRMRGWALFKSSEDNIELLDAIGAQLGAPGDVFTFGGSMGGLIAIKMAEHPELINKVKGIYSVCPVAGGARAWDQALDVRLIYDAVCKDVGGAELPRGNEPLPWATNLPDIPDNLGELQSADELARLAARMNQCFGYGLPDLLRSNNQKERRDKLMQFTGVTEENWLAAQIGYAAFALGDLVRDPQKLNGQSPVRSVRTLDSQLQIQIGLNDPPGEPAPGDDEIRYCKNAMDLFAPDCGTRLNVKKAFENRDAAYQLARVSNLSGTSPAPILSLHTNKDELVVPEHQRTLRNKYQSGKLAQTLVNETTSSHCGFTDEELETGWNVLREWRGGAVAPTASSLQSRCIQTQSNAADCRFASAENVARLRTAIRQRETAWPNRVSGSWYNATRSGEGIFLEELSGGWPNPDDPPQRALLTLYSYNGIPNSPTALPPPPDTRRPQSWLIGVGEIIGNGIHFPLIQDAQGARFGSAFNASDVQLLPWAKGDLIFGYESFPGNFPDWVESKGQAKVLLLGVGAENIDFATTIEQLTVLGKRKHGAELIGFGSPILFDYKYFEYRSGTYYNPSRSGEGIQLTQFGPESAFTGASVPSPDLRSLLVWYTYNLEGRQLWLIGEGVHTNSNTIRFDMLRTVGDRFAAGFDPNEIQRLPWGTVTLEAQGCNITAMRYEALDANYGNGRIELSRLTNPVHVTNCPYQ